MLLLRPGRLENKKRRGVTWQNGWGVENGTLRQSHVYLNSVQQMVSGELAGEGLQTGFSKHGLPPQRAPPDTVYPPQRAPKQCPVNGVRRIL